MKSIDEVCGLLEEMWRTVVPYQKVVVIGAGFWGRLACEELEEMGKEVVAVCDNSASKHTEKFYYSSRFMKWVACQSIESIAKALSDTVIYVISPSKYYHELSKQVGQLVRGQCVSYENYARCFHTEELKEAYSSLQRKESKDTLCTLLQAGLEYNADLYKEIYSPNRYFGIDEFLQLDKDEILVEAGSGIGDTLEEYIWRRRAIFAKVYAFEPGDRMYAALQFRGERLIREWAMPAGKLNLIKAAIGDEEAIAEYSENDLMGNGTVNQNPLMIEGESAIKVVTIDSYFEEQKVDLIWADIEGYENRLIKGAERIIRKNKPKIAICVYHKPNDIWWIMKRIREINSSYKFDMLHHRKEDREETVLYCY